MTIIGRWNGCFNRGKLNAWRLKHIRKSSLDQRDHFRELCRFCRQDSCFQLTLSHYDFIKQCAQFLLDRLRCLWGRRGGRQRLQAVDRDQQLLGIGIAVAPGVFSKEGAASRTRRQRVTKRLIIALVRGIERQVGSGRRLGRHVQSLAARLSIMWLDSASRVAGARSGRSTKKLTKVMTYRGYWNRAEATRA